MDGVAGLKEAGPQEISFFAHARYREDLESTRAGAVLVSDQPPPGHRAAFIRVRNPHLAFARIAQLFHPRPRFEPGVHSQAWVHPEAQVDPSATVMAHASVDRGARVGPRAVLFPGVYLGEGARVGEGSILYPNVTVREHCVVGARCILHASSVVGADGFGFAYDEKTPAHVKVPQAGIARLEDDVELGAGSCVDRGTTGETLVGRGSKIDNLVQIAHNVRIGALSILCAQVGISGSTELGAGAVLAGQVGVVGHLKLGAGMRAGAQSGIAQDVPDGESVSGYPAFPHKEWLRSVAAFKTLPELAREVRELRRELEKLQREKSK
jgi:UDP-3-O-[3-hydroxymyristoyl] glucosamine N-acyltransferase